MAIPTLRRAFSIAILILVSIQSLYFKVVEAHEQYEANFSTKEYGLKKLEDVMSNPRAINEVYNFPEDVDEHRRNMEFEILEYLRNDFNGGGGSNLEGISSFLSDLNALNWKNHNNWRQDPFAVKRKKSLEIFDGSVGNGLKDYLSYDWGPNPTIWGSMRQLKPRGKPKISSPKNEEYFNPSYVRYGWHSNQNFWGKRGFLNRKSQDFKASSDKNSTLRRIKILQDNKLNSLEPKLSLESNINEKTEFISKKGAYFKTPNTKDFEIYSHIFWSPRGRSETLQNNIISNWNLRTKQENLKTKKVERVVFEPRQRMSLFNQIFDDVLTNYNVHHQPGNPNLRVERLRGKKDMDFLFDKLNKLSSGAFIAPRG